MRRIYVLGATFVAACTAGVGCGSEDTTKAATSSGSGGAGGDASSSSGSAGAGGSSSSSGAGGGSSSVCGDSLVQAGEACDLGKDNGAETSCCAADCTLTKGNTCRHGSGDVCDPDEVCNGASVECPDDTVAETSVVCRNGSGDTCDPDEFCTGIVGAACPADTVADTSVVCRNGSGDACDPDEFCTGQVGAACPADTVAEASVVCRQGSGDACDPDERCTGMAGAACPGDTVAEATVVCRNGSGDACDPDEFCTGQVGAACPADTIADTAVVCRPGSGDICDPDERCTGMAGAMCPADIVNGQMVCFTDCSNTVTAMCTGVPGEVCPGCQTLAPLTGKTAVIVESQSNNPGHDMDVEWRNLATSLGVTAAIYPQTVLDTNDFFATTDILIISSGIITLPPNRVTTILDFFQSGKGVYLQGEYLTTFSANVAFKTIVEATGGTFTWTSSLNGDLAPISATGCLAASNLCTSPLSSFYYGATGTWTGAGLTSYMASNGKAVGWTYYPPGLGRMIFNTDQDWVRTRDMYPAHGDLMTNILMRLGNP